MDLADRINGWKAIGAYFGRDRTTALRWAKDRNLPVHRLPGGKTGTVYAFKQELDLWASGQAAVEASDTPKENAGEPLPPQAVVDAPSPSRLPARRVWIVAGVLSVAASLLVGTLIARPSAPTAPTTPPVVVQPAAPLPTDQKLAEMYLRASDLVGERTAGGLEEAISLLRDINRRDPAYAPAYASLAEALLLSREFGMRRDTDVFPQARTAARTAIRLAPNLAAAHRALGFIAYWSDHDRTAAGVSFRRAIALDPSQSLTRFWYGNILSDNGDHDAARRELDAARLSQPGSIAIQTDFAWALWAAGDEANALPMLERIAIQHPDFAVVHDCQSIIRLAQGDYGGYAQALTRFADAREDEVLIAYARDVDAAQADSIEAVQKVMMTKALADLEADGSMTRAWASFLASVAGDRPALLLLLRTADGRREVWGDAGLVLRMQQRWRDDPEIQALIRRRTAPSIA